MSTSQVRRFVVMSDLLSESATEQLTKYFQSFGAGWAKYFTGGFLVATYDTTVTANDIAAKLGQIAPGVDCIAVEVFGTKKWSFILQDAQLKQNFKQWLETYW